MVLNFTTSRYTLLFLYSEIYVAYVINCEWSRFVNFSLCISCMWYKYVFFQQTHLSNASQPYSFGRRKMIRMQKLQLWSLIFRLLGVFQRSRNTRPPELPKCGHTRLRQQPSFLICIVQALIGHIHIFYWKETYSVGLDLCFQTHVCVFRLFFFQRVNSNITWIYCAGDKKHCSRFPRYYSHIKKLFCYNVFSFQFQQK